MPVETDCGPPDGGGRWRKLGVSPSRLAVLALLGLALFLRLLFLPDARFTGDEALFYEQATRAAWGEWFPWIGPVVTDGPLHHPGGTFYLLMALPLTVTRSPLGPMALVAFLNVLAYGLLYCVIARRYGAGVGLLFLGLLVFSPWSFFYSDRIWNSNLVLPLAALFLWAVCHVLDTPRSPRLFWAVFALVLLPQFHLSVLLLGVLGLLLLVIYRPPLRWRSALFGLGAGLMFYVPYLVVEVRTGFANTRLLFTGTAGGGDGPREALRALAGFLTLPTAELSYFAERGFWFPHDVFAYYQTGAGLAGLAEFAGGGVPGALLVAALLLSVLLAAVGLVFLCVRAVARPRQVVADPLDLSFLLSLVIVPAVFLASNKPFFPHYIYPLYPLAFVAPLAALRPLLACRRARRTAVAAAVALVAVVAVSQVALSARYYADVDSPFGVRSTTQAVETILDVAQGGPVDISFDVEKSRLGPQPLLRLARRQYLQQIAYDPAAARRVRIFSPSRWQVFQALPESRQRIRGARVSGFRVFPRVVIVWAE
jgi:hypothetical protein